MDVWCLDMFRLVEFHRIPAAVGPFENIPMGTNPTALTESDLSGVDLWHWHWRLHEVAVCKDLRCSKLIHDIRLDQHAVSIDRASNALRNLQRQCLFKKKERCWHEALPLAIAILVQFAWWRWSLVAHCSVHKKKPVGVLWLNVTERYFSFQLQKSEEQKLGNLLQDSWDQCF